MKNIWTIIAFVFWFLAIYFLQFFAWSYAPAQSATEIKFFLIRKYAWLILSFPIFWICPERIADEHFFALQILNCLVWGSVWLIIFFYIRKFLYKHS